MSGSVISARDLIGRGYNKWWHARNFYKINKGSRGSKKSWNQQTEIIAKMMAYPWMNWVVARRYATTLRDSVYVGLKAAANRLGASELWRFTTSPMEATYLPTGQKILFRGFDDAIKLTSIQLERGTLTHVWIEEAYELESRDKLDTLVEGLRGELPKGAYRQVVMTFNPWSEHHWIKAAFYDKESPDVLAITTTYKCNEFLDAATVNRYERLYQENPRRARIVCDGEWGKAEGLVYNNVTYRPIDPGEVRKLPIQIGLDFGYTHDPTALTVNYVDEERKILYITDEHYERGMLSDDIADMIRRKGYENAVIIGDCAEGRLIEELRRKGIRRLKACEKGADSIRQGIDQLLTYRIVCDSSLRNTREEFESYAYEQDKLTGKFTNKPIDADNHIMDALRYSLQCGRRSLKVKTFSGGI
ncbi:MAG: PBSX family phage terminase large subunit [Eubacteriales bacterium]|nr:PBSX family phage terminase large subunit [Eubacteriales bacterium]